MKAWILYPKTRERFRSKAGSNSKNKSHTFLRKIPWEHPKIAPEVNGVWGLNVLGICFWGPST